MGTTSGLRPSHSLPVAAVCSYNDECGSPGRKRRRAINLKEHDLDFLDAPSVFEGTTFTFEDDRFAYGEQRFGTLGLLSGVPVSVLHTETENEIRVISFRKATKREAKLNFQEVQD
jgi:uncharacterized DUF497 family protein